MATNRKSLCLLCLAVALCAGEMLACIEVCPEESNNDIGRREVRINLGYFFHREGRRR